MLVLLALVAAGCATSTYVDGETLAQDIPLAREQALEEDGIRATVEVPTAASAARVFGLQFAEYGIQPILLRIENNSDTDYWLLPNAIDPDYFSADEAALAVGSGLPAEELHNLRRLLRANALPFFHPAGGSRQGYVYASYARGGRFVDVVLSGHRSSVRLRFAVLLPTEGFDYEYSQLRERYAKLEELPDLDTDELRDRLAALPCCVTNEAGDDTGDPLNIVIIGHAPEFVSALVASGWQFTEAITADSIRRMLGAAIAEKEFLTAPVSALYLFGRRQDVAMQRGRSNINQRNHMRLWLAPFRTEGRPVWVGQVSRDIGVKFTSKSASLTTHVIDPVVDESREYLLTSLLHDQSVERFAFVRGVGRATPDAPKFNLTDDPYFTDGLRLVVWVSSEPVPPGFADNLGWNDSTDPVLEGRGQYSVVPYEPDDPPEADTSGEPDAPREPPGPSTAPST